MPFDRLPHRAPDAQLALFDLPAPSPVLPEGLYYQPDWLTPDDEATTIALVRTLPFQHATYKGYTARRRVVGYGGRYDFDHNRLMPGPPLIDALYPLRDRVAAMIGVSAASLAHVLVSEYAPGTPLGWHRDVPDFEVIAGVSLGAPATMRFRPHVGRASTQAHVREDVLRLTVAPRSIYVMRGPARWAWQHDVAPVDALRWSITFRTRRAR